MHRVRPDAREPIFVPLAVAAARAAVATLGEPSAVALAQVVQRHAEAVDAAAIDCWTALLAGCRTPACGVVAARLRELTEATSLLLGTRCWFAPGSPHRGRVSDAETRISDAVWEGDGAEFAEAFAGYDQAVATAVASIRLRTSSSA
jgi:hypothetical protein